MSFMDKLKENIVEVIDTEAIVYNDNEVEKKISEKKKKDEAKKREKQRILKRKLKIETDMFLKAIPENIKTDDEFPLFFPFFEKLFNTEDKIVVVAANTLKSLNLKMKKFIHEYKDEKVIQLSGLYDEVKIRFNTVAWEYNHNNFTMYHLHNDFSKIYPGANVTQLKEKLSKFTQYERIFIGNYEMDLSPTMKTFRETMGKYKIRNDLKISQTPGFFEIFKIRQKEV